MAKVNESETQKLIRAGRNAGSKAIEESFALGHPVYIVEDGLLVSVDKEGKKTIIKKLDEQNFRG